MCFKYDKHVRTEEYHQPFQNRIHVKNGWYMWLPGWVSWLSKFPLPLWLTAHNTGCFSFLKKSNGYITWNLLLLIKDPRTWFYSYGLMATPTFAPRRFPNLPSSNRYGSIIACPSTTWPQCRSISMLNTGHEAAPRHPRWASRECGRSNKAVPSIPGSSSDITHLLFEGSGCLTRVLDGPFCLSGLPVQGEMNQSISTSSDAQGSGESFKT